MSKFKTGFLAACIVLEVFGLLYAVFDCGRRDGLRSFHPTQYEAWAEAHVVYLKTPDGNVWEYYFD